MARKKKASKKTASKTPASLAKPKTAKKKPSKRPAASPSKPPDEAEAPQALAPANELPDLDDFDLLAPPASSFPVVGIGASAGGLEAFTDLLKELPSDTGLGYVFIQHLDPRHKSNLAEILARSTTMPVSEATDKLVIEPDHIYVMPPDRDLAIRDGQLQLVPRPERPEPHMPIDQCLRSLAESHGDAAIGIILSGMGTDGAFGLAAIKSGGGYGIAQDPDTAKYDGMPRNAIASGHVDLVLSPEQIADELARIDDHLISYRNNAKRRIGFPMPPMQRIFGALRTATGVDFAQYKESTVERRIARRMVLHRLEGIDQYADYLRKTPSEVGGLFQDMLIGVTGFFREPETFEALKDHVFPQVIAGKDEADNGSIRIWVPGCATGEEVYSIAIILLEFLDEQELQFPIQVFATDINESAIVYARAALYPFAATTDVSPGRLRRYFRKTENGYQVSKSIRDLCVFARQDVTHDPPFSKVDLLSCRNVLIYLKTSAQKQIIPVFHYALNPNGFLLLGSSESIGGFTSLFQNVDVKQRIYQRKAASVRLPSMIKVLRDGQEVHAAVGEEPVAATREHVFLREADRAVLRRYAPAGVVINEQMQIIQFRGQTGRFLEHGPGTPTMGLLDLCRPGLLLGLRRAVMSAIRSGGLAREEGLRVRHNGDHLIVNVEVLPIGDSEGDGRRFVVLFDVPRDRSDREADEKPEEAKKRKGERRHKEEDEVRQLREELTGTREMAQRTLEEHNTLVEELRAANEEIQSSNEELQSTNEELETAKEELQSSNEELMTLNEELESRNAELSRVADDLTNLIASVNIPVLILGADLRIRLFTSAAERVLGLRSGDVGRPVLELKLGVAIPDLENLVARVIDELTSREQEVQSWDGTSVYSMVIRPYRTAENKIDGAVIALLDITERKRAQQEASRRLAQSIVDTVPVPLLVLDPELAVVAVGQSFYQTFDVQPTQTKGKYIYELGNGQWDIPALRELLKEVLEKDTAFEDFRVVHTFPSIGKRTMLLSARQIYNEHGPSGQILLMIKDVTDHE